jgi:hypothetical protein
MGGIGYVIEGGRESEKSFRAPDVCRRVLKERRRPLPTDPLGHGQPVWIVLSCKLPASSVASMAARLGRERMHEKKALAWIAGSYQRRDMLEATPR